MPAHKDNGTVQSSPAGGKKPYQVPRLCCYGDVGAITLHTGNKGNGDGSHNRNRTLP